MFALLFAVAVASQQAPVKVDTPKVAKHAVVAKDSTKKHAKKAKKDSVKAPAKDSVKKPGK